MLKPINRSTEPIKPIRNSQFAIRNDARGLATATLTQLRFVTGI